MTKKKDGQQHLVTPSTSQFTLTKAQFLTKFRSLSFSFFSFLTIPRNGLIIIIIIYYYYFFISFYNNYQVGFQKKSEKITFSTSQSVEEIERIFKEKIVSSLPSSEVFFPLFPPLLPSSPSSSSSPSSLPFPEVLFPLLPSSPLFSPLPLFPSPLFSPLLPSPSACPPIFFF